MHWAAISAVALGAMSAVIGQSPKVLPPYAQQTLIAHRGASAYAPEHTLEAYRLALDQGANFVEPDLQITKDGVLVCLHDASLERTTNVRSVFPNRSREIEGRPRWPVSDFTLAEIQQLDAGSWMNARFAEAKVPTFQEAVDVLRGKAGIIPETKGPETYGTLGFDMEQLVMAALAKNGLDKPGADPKTPVILQSFSADSLRKLRAKHACKLPLVYLLGGKQPPSLEELKRIREFADGIGPNKKLIEQDPRLVEQAHGLGMSVTVWTLGTRDAAKQDDVRKEISHFLNVWKVDAVFTDNPDLFPRR